MKYKKGYKYLLTATETVYLPELLGQRATHPFILLNYDGELIVKKYYAWDGASGPAIDTKTFMRGSLIHDALYQLMREGLLDRSFRDAADHILRRICIKDGMWKIRANWVYWAVKNFAARSIEKDNGTEIEIK